MTQIGIKDYWELKNKVNKNAWLILGKGPSLDKYDPAIHKQYNILALNHVGKLVDADICLIHDKEVLDVSIAKRSKYVLMPYHPHVNFRPYPDVYVPFWKNVYYFNLSTWKGEVNSSSPVVRAKYFSAESAFHVLALFGVKVIYSLGLDGGTKYSNYFKDLKPLTNGQKSFDKQFGEINKTIAKFKIEYKAI